MYPNKRHKVILSLLVVVALAWWFYPRQPPILGYIGTAPNPEGIAGVRPTVEFPIDGEHLKDVQLSIDGQSISEGKTVLLRKKKVTLRGQLQLDHLPPSANLLVVQVALASKSNNVAGMLVEGESVLYAGAPALNMGACQLDLQLEWLVPDHAGEFDLHVSFFIAVDGQRESRRRHALVVPVKVH